MDLYNEYAKQDVTFTSVYDKFSLVSETLVTIPSHMLDYKWVDKIKDIKRYITKIIDIRVFTPNPLSPDYLTISFSYIAGPDGHEDIVNVVKGVINE